MDKIIILLIVGIGAYLILRQKTMDLSSVTSPTGHLLPGVLNPTSGAR